MKKNIAIFTNFTDFKPGYSLTGIVLDQCRMLLDNGHNVSLIVHKNFKDGLKINNLFLDYLVEGEELKQSFFLKNISIIDHLQDYKSYFKMSDLHHTQSEEQAQVYKKFIEENKIDIILTHDLIFTGWNLPYSLSIKKCYKKLSRKVKWFHWVHSVPSGQRDYWSIHKYGEENFIVFPNKSEVNRVANAFVTSPLGVKVIPHIKDIRSWFDFSPESWQFTKDFPQTMNAEVMQVYPCSTDRLIAKRLDIMIKIFGWIKLMTNLPVCLIAVNQWATGRQRKEDIGKYQKLAEDCGLELQKDFIFTSEYKKEYETGINQRMIRELMLLSNLFIFPTREESFGLVGPEAALSGVLVIGNKSLGMMQEVLGDVPSYHFGSFYNQVNDFNIEDVSASIMNLLLSDEAIMAKTYAKKRYSMDHIYRKYYLPKILGA